MGRPALRVARPWPQQTLVRRACKGRFVPQLLWGHGHQPPALLSAAAWPCGTPTVNPALHPQTVPKALQGVRTL